MAEDLSDIIRDLHHPARRLADLVLTGAVRDEVTAIRVGSSTPKHHGGLCAEDWPEATQPGIGISMRFPDGMWCQLIDPGMIFRDAVLHYLVVEKGVSLAGDGPVAGQFVTDLGGVRTTWQVSGDSKDDEITLTRRRRGSGEVKVA